MMKRILFILVLFASVSASAQFPTTDSLRKYINRYIRNSAIDAFTNLRLNTALLGLTRFSDSTYGGQVQNFTEVTPGVIQLTLLNGQTYTIDLTTTTGSLTSVGGGVPVLKSSTEVKTFTADGTMILNNNLNTITIRADTSVLASKDWVLEQIPDSTTYATRTYVDTGQANLRTELLGKQPVGNYITQLNGDVIANGPGNSNAVLSNTTVVPGTYTNLTATIDSKGRITYAESGTGGGGSGTDNILLGTGHRLLVPSSQGIKTLFGGHGVYWDSTAFSQGLSVNIDSSKWATATQLSGKISYTDTSALFLSYRNAINARVKYGDTATMLNAYQVAINGKQSALGFTPENVANKSNNTALGTSATLYPTQNAVKVYTDAGLALKQDLLGYTPENVASKSTNTALGVSNILYPSQNAVKVYVDNGLATKQNTLSLTTTGSGAATLIGDVLNIPIPAGSTYTAGVRLTLSGNQFNVDSLGLLAPYQTALNARVRYTDTATMLAPYAAKINTKLENITGKIIAGTNVTITGAGTTASPYEINASPGGGGSGTVNTGLANRLAYYTANGTVVDDLAAITANRLLVSDANGLPTHSTATATEAGYLAGVTSGIQTQLNGKEATLPVGTSAQYFRGDKTLGTFPTDLSSFANGPGYLTNITGKVTAGANISITGAGTTASPYVIAGTGSGGNLPPGGTAGQILSKINSTDYNAQWIPAPSLNIFEGYGINIDGENNISIDSSVLSTGYMRRGNLVAGTNITITPQGNQYVIASSGGGSGITALTGDIVASGTGSVSSSIANGAVTNDKVASGIEASKSVMTGYTTPAAANTTVSATDNVVQAISKIEAQLQFIDPKEYLFDYYYAANGNDGGAALNAINALMPSTGGVIRVRNGVYNFTTAATMTKPFKLIGTGYQTTFRTTSTTLGLLTISTTTLGSLVQDIHFLNEAGSNPTAGFAIRTTGSGGNYNAFARYENVVMTRFYDNFVNDLGSVSVWNKCMFRQAVRHGLSNKNVYNPDSGDSYISDCYFDGNVSTPTVALIKQESSGGLKVTNSKFNSNNSTNKPNYSIWVNLDGNTSDLLVSNNSFENFGISSIRIGIANPTSVFREITITGNQFAAWYGNSSWIIDIEEDVEGISITGNVFRLEAGSGGFNGAVRLTNVNSATLLNTYTGFSTQNPVSITGSTNILNLNDPAFGGGATPSLQTVTNTGSTTTNPISFTTATGSDRGVTFSNPSLADFTAYMKLQPTSGTNVGTTFTLTGKGTGGGTYMSRFNLYNTDVVGNVFTNQELLSISAGGTSGYTLNSLASGTGTVRGISLQTNSITRIGVSGAGLVSFYNGAYTFPSTIGTAGQALRVPASGTTLEWATISSGGGTLQDVTTAGNTTTNSIALTTATGTNRAVVLSNLNAADNLAFLRIVPNSGTDVAGGFIVSGRGVGASGVRSRMTLYNTDYVADQTNVEAMTFTATGTAGYTLNSIAAGTGVGRDFAIQTNSVNRIGVSYAGVITFNASTNSYTFPTGRGTSGQVLTTDGAGGLSWAAGGGGSGDMIKNADNLMGASGMIRFPASTSNSSLRYGGLEIQSRETDISHIGGNVYFNGTSYIRRDAGKGVMAYFGDASFGIFSDATEAAAGSVATMTPRLQVAATGAITLSNLAGTGTRMVVADASGVLSTQAIPSGGGGTGTVTSVSGGTTGLTFSNATTTPTMGGILSVGHGGTGTATPSLIAGSGISITGSWPNQTVSATGGGSSDGSIGMTFTGAVTGATTTSYTGSLQVDNGEAGIMELYFVAKTSSGEAVTRKLRIAYNAISASTIQFFDAEDAYAQKTTDPALSGVTFGYGSNGSGDLVLTITGVAGFSIETKCYVRKYPVGFSS